MLDKRVDTLEYRKRLSMPVVTQNRQRTVIGQAPATGQAPELVPAAPVPAPEELLEPQKWVPRIEVRPCHKHGNSRRLPGSPICADPQCVERMVRSMGYRFGYIGNCIQILEKRCVVQDFVSTLLESYLRQRRAGKEPMIRPQWVAWQMSAFLRKKSNGNRNETLVDPEMVQGTGVFVNDGDVDVNYQDVLSESAATALSDGEYGGLRKYLEVREVSDYIVAAGGAVALLVLREDITLSDAWLLDEQKREMGQSLAQRALEVEFVRCWVALWAKYRRKEVDDGGSGQQLAGSDDSADGDVAGRGTDGGRWACWDEGFRIEEAFGPRKKSAARHSESAQGGRR